MKAQSKVDLPRTVCFLYEVRTGNLLFAPTLGSHSAIYTFYRLGRRLAIGKKYIEVELNYTKTNVSYDIRTSDVNLRQKIIKIVSKHAAFKRLLTAVQIKLLANIKNSKRSQKAKYHLLIDLLTNWYPLSTQKFNEQITKKFKKTNYEVYSLVIQIITTGHKYISVNEFKRLCTLVPEKYFSYLFDCINTGIYMPTKVYQNVIIEEQKRRLELAETAGTKV